MNSETVTGQNLNNRTKSQCESLGKITQALFSLLIIFSTTATLPFLNYPGIPGFARNNGFVLVSLGLLALLASKRSGAKLNELTSSFLPFAIVGSLSSIIMGFYLSQQFGALAGETPLSAIITGLMWLLFDVGIVFFVSCCYERSTIHHIDVVMDVLVVVVLIICGIQALAMFGVPGFASLFELINIGGWLSVFEEVDFLRLVGVGSEPAAMAQTLGLFCLPYCYCRATHDGISRYWFAFALLVLFAFLTKATTVYVTVVLVLIGIAVLNIRRKQSKGAIAVIAVACAVLSVAFLVVLIAGISLVPADVESTFEAVLGKISDGTNMSTAYRSSTVINDVEIFKEFPIFGVGDGNQGFFYAQNLPSWALTSGSLEVAAALSGSIGVLNGGAFLPSIISGYGIVGAILFGAWIIVCVRMARSNRARMGHYYDMYFLAMLACVPICCMAISFQGAPVAVFLIFCLPALGAKQ